MSCSLNDIMLFICGGVKAYKCMSCYTLKNEEEKINKRYISLIYDFTLLFLRFFVSLP
jgi:hypothetical protein